MTRRRRWKPASLARRAALFVFGSLLAGLLTVFLEGLLGVYLPRHFSVSLAVGLAVTVTFWILRFLRHPPMLLKNVHPLAAGLCAGLGVHIARFWIR